jgi:hypothetical protein
MKNLITETLWAIVAWIVTRRDVREWLIRRAKKTPYTPIMNRAGDETYMNRLWLFNPYEWPAGSPTKQNWLMRRLPSIRIHHIRLPDQDRDEHCHPWAARTIILSGWYIETRDGVPFKRKQGDTATLTADEFHTITHVSTGGVLTMFITWKYQRSWGFKTPTGFVPWRTYLDVPEASAWALTEEQQKAEAEELQSSIARTRVALERVRAEFGPVERTPMIYANKETRDKIHTPESLAVLRKTVDNLKARRHDSTTSRPDDSNTGLLTMYMLNTPAPAPYEPEPPRFSSGSGGDFGGAGATGSWGDSSDSPSSSSCSSSGND